MPETKIKQSICPICKKTTAAAYNTRGGFVCYDIECPEHGVFSTIASEHPEDFARWTAYESICVPPRKHSVIPDPIRNPSETSCPLNCGLCEQHLMTACCVLIDVTQRCNQHCPWCFARAGEEVSADPPLPLISDWYDRLLELGEERTFNIQLSGGEPTVRDDLPDIIKTGREKGFEYIQLNTNGRRIAQEKGYAQKLAKAGLSTVFLQFDGLTDDIYEALRGEPLRKIKLEAIEECRAARLPVTLVPTIVKDVNTQVIGDLIRFVTENTSVIKGIHFQPASFFGRTPYAPEPENPERLSGGRTGNDSTLVEGSTTVLGCPQRTPCGQTPPETVPDSPAPVDCTERVTMFEVMRQIEAQTGGLINASDLVPITTGHPLCCFCADFLREKDGTITPLTTQKQKEEGNACCCELSEEEELEIIKKDRDFVLKKWVVGDENETPPFLSGDKEMLSLDEAVAYIQRNTFTVSGMAFMDETNLDADRLRRCRVQQFTPDGRLIPFCAYNTFYR